MRSLRASVLAAIAIATNAEAQKVSENVIIEAQDAFGAKSGSDSLGIYRESEVRGFSPLVAGNLRVEGLYADLWVPPGDRLADHSVIRVGPETVGAILAAPSGTVDYSLRKAGLNNSLGVRASLDTYGSAVGEADGGLGRTDGVLSSAMGLSRASGPNATRSDPGVWSMAIVPRWHPSESLEALAFYERTSDHELATPLLYTSGSFRPPVPADGHMLGQTWSRVAYDVSNAGLILNSRFPGRWQLRGGFFRSMRAQPSDAADLITDISSAGLGDHMIYLFPGQRYFSLSGEARVEHEWAWGALRNQFTLAARWRMERSRYGGEAEIDLGNAKATSPVRVPPPPIAFSNPQDFDRTRQLTVAADLHAEIRHALEFDLGAGTSHYRKAVTSGGEQPRSSSASPFLYNALARLSLDANWSAYASVARGMEASGTAPSSALNRGEVLPAIITQQEEAGLRGRWGGLSIGAGLFQIEKPYASLGANGIFAIGGSVRHRGIELSASGRIADGPTAVLGAERIYGSLSGNQVERGRIAKEPIALPHFRGQAAVNYAPERLADLSFEGTLTLTGRQCAKLDGSLQTPTSANLDMGFRKRLRVGNHQAQARFQILNVTGYRFLDVGPDEGMSYEGGRSAKLTLTFDL